MNKCISKATAGNYGYTVKHISAKPGDPSTFWSPDNGQTWYRTEKEARQAELDGKKTGAVNPDNYVYNKSFWAQNKKTILWCLAFLLLAAGGFYLYHKGNITFHIHKS